VNNVVCSGLCPPLAHFPNVRSASCSRVSHAARSRRMMSKASSGECGKTAATAPRLTHGLSFALVNRCNSSPYRLVKRYGLGVRTAREARQHAQEQSLQFVDPDHRLLVALPTTAIRSVSQLWVFRMGLSICAAWHTNDAPSRRDDGRPSRGPGETAHRPIRIREHRWRRAGFAYPEVFQRPPWGSAFAYVLGYVVLPLRLVLLLVYGQADPTPFAIACRVTEFWHWILGPNHRLFLRGWVGAAPVTIPRQ
jgi:hypothetical protein